MCLRHFTVDDDAVPRFTVMYTHGTTLVRQISAAVDNCCCRTVVLTRMGIVSLLFVLLREWHVWRTKMELHYQAAHWRTWGL